MTDHDPAPRAFYSEPGRMTAVGSHAPQIDKLPHDVGALAAVAQGLLIHEHMAQAYGVTLTDDDRSSVHVRPADQLLDLIVARDDRPLDAPRPPATRLPGNCRHFSVLMVAMLRAQGTPAACPVRLRCLLRRGRVRRPLGVRVLERRAGAMDPGRRADRRGPARVLPDRLRRHRRAARPFPRRGRRLAPIPSGRRRPEPVRPQRGQGVRRLVDRREPHARHRGAAQHRTAAVGCLGRHARTAGRRSRRHSTRASTVSPR